MRCMGPVGWPTRRDSAFCHEANSSPRCFFNRKLHLMRQQTSNCDKTFFYDLVSTLPWHSLKLGSCTRDKLFCVRWKIMSWCPCACLQSCNRPSRKNDVNDPETIAYRRRGAMDRAGCIHHDSCGAPFLSPH